MVNPKTPGALVLGGRVRRWCVAPPILPDPQSGKAQRTPELPKQRALTPCQLERIAETLLGGRNGSMFGFPQQQLALDAQQLSHVPSFVPGFAAPQRLVDGAEALRDLASLTETR